ncbi:uncharacterized protein [Haliotis cracherodii]|uniref:uncharacterized protein n=1 Tax=Haliotis cracherodii TaxID=6455 RepID=UPI0039EB9454
MASLVADYGSEDDLSENEGLGDEECQTDKDTRDRYNAKNFLITNDDTDSDDSDCNRQDAADCASQDEKDRLPNPLEDKLPTPDIGQQGRETVTSVFKNPFEQAELVKNSILEKHVRMTEKLPEKGTKQVCWKFKKGKCRMGKNCRYFHDQESVTGLVVETKLDENEPQKLGHNHKQLYFGSVHKMQGKALEPEPVDDDNYMAGKKRKSRVGMSNALVPPKKAMSSLERQRNSERPWTVNK